MSDEDAKQEHTQEEAGEERTQEGTEQGQVLDQQEYMQKKVAYYQALVSTWIDNRMEVNKRILILSGLAIGLLTTFRSEIDDVLAFCAWLVAGVSFIVTIVIILLGFRQNSDYVECVIHNGNQSEGMHLENKNKEECLEKSLRRKDMWVFGLFVLGIVLTAFLAVYGTGFVIVKGE